ncbi:MAG: outer membrane beta-barrel protein [Sphingomonadales bacterium]|nr:outer membrane beta-barrel protein [Sphingomonadales bacterium]
MKRKHMTLASTALAAVLGAGIGSAALAGGYTQPVVEAPVVTPAPALAPRANWDGFYAGAQLGYGQTDGGIVDDEGVVGGLQAGYLRDMGSFVAGGELAYSGANLDDGTGEINGVTDLKLIGGVPSGQWLYYGALGASHIDADYAGAGYSDVMPFVGLGAKYAVNEQWAVGGELGHRIGNGFDGTGEDLDLTTLNATVSFKF